MDDRKINKNEGPDSCLVVNQIEVNDEAKSVYMS